jgi:hypothetical protein
LELVECSGWVEVGGLLIERGSAGSGSRSWSVVLHADS